MPYWHFYWNFIKYIDRFGSVDSYEHGIAFYLLFEVSLLNNVLHEALYIFSHLFLDT